MDDKQNVQSAITAYVQRVVSDYADVIRGLDELEQLQYAGFLYYQNLEREGILLWMNPSVPMPDYVGSVLLKN